MATSKSIHVIHASDAEQHLGNLQGILETLKNENRIGNYTNMESSSINSDSFTKILKEDMVVMLLTNGIESVKASIEEWLLKLKDKQPEIKIAEIIVDNIPYEPQLIAFPTDLEPIRSREDMDMVWNQIGQSLRDMFPAEVPPIDPPIPWGKYVAYAMGILVVGGLIYWLTTSDLFGKKPVADFSYRVLDPVKEDVIANAEDCYIPCKVFFNDKSLNAKNIQWNLKDTTIINERDPEHVFLRQGNYELTLEVSNGKKKHSVSKPLTIKAPPFTDFAIINNGCTAPCELQFKNSSKNASIYKWSFLGGTVPNNSNKVDPGRKKYNSHGKFKVKLEISNEDGVKAEDIQEVTILRDNSPFADFTSQNLSKVSSITKKYPSKQKFRFKSTSKNATQYRWEINKGPTLLSVKTTANFDYVFNGYGNYSVKLMVRGPAGTQPDETFKNINVSQYNKSILQNKEYLRRVRDLNILGNPN